MSVFEVGKMYEEGVKDYEQEIRFDATPSGPVLSLFYKNTSPKEIKRITTGRVELGFYERREEGVLFFLAKFEGMVPMDAAYSIHLSTFVETLELQESDVEMQIVLVNCKEGDIRGVRTVKLPDRFSKKLKDALEEQRSKPFDAVTYYRTVHILYDNYSTKDFMKRADVLYTFKQE